MHDARIPRPYSLTDRGVANSVQIVSLSDGAEIAYTPPAVEPANAELTFIFVHGAGGRHGAWAPQVLALNVSPWAAIALALPGHGAAAGPIRATVDAYARDVQACLVSLQAQHVVLCGFSLGGAIALQVAIRGEPRLAGISLVATGAKLGVRPMLLEALTDHFDQAVEGARMTAFGPEADDAVRDHIAADFRANGPDVCLADFQACDAFDVRPLLDAVAVPACVICGTNDQLTPPRYSEYLHEHLPESRLHVEPGPGHLISLEAPSVVTTVIRAFGRWLVTSRPSATA